MRVDALALQGCEHARPLFKRDLALGRAAAEEHGNLSEIRATHHFLPSRPPACREPADRAGAHRHHHVAIAGDIENRLRQIGDVLDEDRLDLAGDAQARASARPSAATIGCSPAA
jgi:hypothetical protein